MAPANSVTVEPSATAEPASGPSQRLAASSISNDLGFLLAKLHAAGSVLNNAALARFGLKERSYSVLALAGGDLEPTQREMAEFLSLDPSQVVALIDELEQRALVKRTVGRTDRRHKLVAVTAKGRKVLAAAQQAAQEAEAAQLAMLAPEEVTALKDILGKAVWAPASPRTVPLA